MGMIDAMVGGRGERLTAEAYCAAALELLADEGSDSLTVARLCERLDITKGSFYHHFTDLADFTHQLLEFWELEHSSRLIELMRPERDPIARLGLVIDYSVDLPHATEAALRTWARRDEQVATVVARVDRQRVRFVFDDLLEIGFPRERARLLVHMGHDTLVGRQIRERRVDRARLRATFELMVELALGATAHEESVSA